MSELPPNIELRSSLHASHAGYSVSDTAMMRALSLAEERHFWHRTRNRLIADHLVALGVRPPAKILELGCGGGCVSAHLAGLGYRVTGVDGHPSRVREAALRAPGARFIIEDLARDDVLADQVGFDAVGLFDVIEHLDDPGAALEQAAARVRPGGWVVGTVPALMSLWSDADVHAGHRLRYDRASLDALLRTAPSAIAPRSVPFNRVLIPLLWLQRRAVASEQESGEQYLRVPWAPLNAAIAGLLRLEQSAAVRFGWLADLPGASLWFAFHTKG